MEITLFRLILEAASSILRLGEKYYKASVAWNDYCRGLITLRQEYNSLISLLEKYGMQPETYTDVDLQERLDAVASSLEAEEARLEKSHEIARYCFCYPCLKLVAFPDHLSDSFSIARGALDDVRKLYRVREEDRAMLGREVRNRTYSARFRHDPSYVHLEDTESAVYEALEDPSGPCFVLLHGGAGRGKSTLARHTAYHYRDRPLSTGTGAREGQKELVFDHVFYLECGRNADASAKLLELLQCVGSCDSTRPGEDGNSGASTSGEKVLVKKMLYARLLQQKVLIILDDIWERNFLEDFVEVFGTKVKCLVTSQDARLIDPSSKIEIQVNLPEARSILARHACLPKDAISPKLQVIFDRIVQKADRHPLALAYLATAINKKKPSYTDEWREVEKSFLKLLNQEDPRTLAIYNRQYPKSLWSSMRLPVDSISNEARQLLLLASICAGPSIPEEVIRIFCQHNQMKEVAAAFTKLRNDLEERSLLVIQLEPLRWFEEEERSKFTWSLHGLQKQFLETEMKEQREVLVTAFLGEDENLDGENKVVNSEEKTLMILYALYFDRDLAERAARKLGQGISCFSETQRAAVEPIIWLIHKPTKEEWSEASVATAKRVLHSYICHKRPRDEDMNHLLLLPFSKEATSEAARKMDWIRYIGGGGGGGKCPSWLMVDSDGGSSSRGYGPDDIERDARGVKIFSY